jgi:hypothetical protein
MAGVTLLDAANFAQGGRDREAADRAAALEQDKVAQSKLQTEEMQRQVTDAAAARKQTASAWEDAKRAAASANDSIRVANQPKDVGAPGYEYNPDTGDVKSSDRTMYQNPTTGETTFDRSKAYGVVPDVKAETLFEREYAGKVRDLYMQQGAPEMAAKFDDFVKSRTGKRYLNEAHQGLQQLAMGDKQGGLKILQDLYNSQVHDGRYGKYEDIGNGQTKLTVYDSRTGQSSSQVIPDAELGQRAAQFLDADYISKHFLTTSASTQKLQTQFNIDVAKERIKAALHDNSKSQEIALQVRGKLLEQQNQAQLDAMLGKGAHVTMDQTGQNIVVTVPGQGVYKMEKDGLKLVPNGSFQAPANAIGMSLDNMVGFTGSPQGVGVNTAPVNAGASSTTSPAPAPVPGFTAKKPDGTVVKFEADDVNKVVATLANASGTDRAALIDQMKKGGVPQPTIDAMVKAADAGKTPVKPKRTAVNLDTGDVTMEDDVPAAAPAAKKPAGVSVPSPTPTPTPAPVEKPSKPKEEEYADGFKVDEKLEQRIDAAAERGDTRLPKDLLAYLRRKADSKNKMDLTREQKRMLDQSREIARTTRGVR